MGLRAMWSVSWIRRGTYLLSVCAVQDGWWRICGNQISVYETENEGVVTIRKSGDAWIPPLSLPWIHATMVGKSFIYGIVLQARVVSCIPSPRRSSFAP